jgi:nitrogen fixation protein NifX
MRIAFASSDGKNIDQHFGTTLRFYLWDIGPESAEAVGNLVPGTDGEEREDKIIARATALDGCTIVYTTQIGGPAAAKLVSRHIHPSKAAPNKPIADAICELQQVLRGRPPPWLRKAAGLSEPEREHKEDADE